MNNSEENNSEQYAKGLLERIMEMPPPEPRNFTIADFQQLVVDHNKKIKAQARYYRKMLRPTLFERIKRRLTPWNYVQIDWVYRKPSRWRRFINRLKPH